MRMRIILQNITQIAFVWVNAERETKSKFETAPNKYSFIYAYEHNLKNTIRKNPT